jgi:hypothetical protein
MTYRTFSIVLAYLLIVLIPAAASPVFASPIRPSQTAECGITQLFHSLDHAIIHWDARGCGYPEARLVITRGTETYTGDWTPVDSAVGDVTYSWAGAAYGDTASAVIQARLSENDPIVWGDPVTLNIDNTVWGNVTGQESVSAAQIPTGGGDNIYVNAVIVEAGGKFTIEGGGVVVITSTVLPCKWEAACLLEQVTMSQTQTAAENLSTSTIPSALTSKPT